MSIHKRSHLSKVAINNRSLWKNYGSQVAAISSVVTLFLRATSQAGMLACTFGDCRRGQYPAALLRCKFDAPSACCGVVDCALVTKKKLL